MEKTDCVCYLSWTENNVTGKNTEKLRGCGRIAKIDTLKHLGLYGVLESGEVYESSPKRTLCLRHTDGKDFA